MPALTQENFELEDFQAFVNKTSELLANVHPDYKKSFIDTFRQMALFTPKLQLELCDLWDFKVSGAFDKVKRNTILNDCCTTFLNDKLQPECDHDHPVLVAECIPNKPKVNKDSLSCSHGNSVCIHHFASSRGCDLGEACRFCHEKHPESEQAQLANEAKTEYAIRGRQSKNSATNIVAIAKSSYGSLPLTPPPEPVYDSGLILGDTDKTVTVSSFIDYLKSITFAIVFQFAVVLYSTQPNALRDADNDIRKYLFHISRHAAVIAGVAKVPIDGVSAGILLFRIAAHMESVPDTQFKTLVRQYVAFLDSISIQQSDNTVLKFEHTKQIFNKMDQVFFPGGFTFPLTSKDLQTNYKTKGPSVSSKDICGDDAHTIELNHTDPLGKATPAINVRELHRRKLCVACRHYLRGMCYRGEACNFCHNPEHQSEYEKSTSNAQFPQKK